MLSTLWGVFAPIVLEERVRNGRVPGPCTQMPAAPTNKRQELQVHGERLTSGAAQLSRALLAVGEP